MYVNRISKSIGKYTSLCFSLLITFWLISIYEVSVTLFSGKEIENVFLLLGFKFMNHFYALLFICVIFLPVYYFISLKRERLSLIIIRIIFVLLVLIEFSLTRYSLTTLLNLGADLLGYSLDDIFLTVTSSESTSFLYFIPFVIFPVLFLTSTFFLRKSRYFKYAGRLFLSITFLILILKFAVSNFSDEQYQNKMYYFTADVIKFKIEKSQLNARQIGSEYPLLKPSKETKDVLGSFFEIGDSKPNIVILLIEGLGSEFVGDKYYSGFTPYLNSLIPKSLFWENFICNTGRTFGALPSLTGSLPFGDKGFLEIDNTPTHLSLFSILKKNGYTTSFFSGDQSSFDKKINYLEYNQVDNIIDENKYDDSYQKANNGPAGFSWGYSDAEIFKKTLAVLDQFKQPRFDLITTQTMHEPFDFPEKEKYLAKIDSLLKSNVKLKATKKQIESYKEIFASILYADESIKMFMESYKQRPEYNNTIFFISGDHRLIPIVQKDKLCRFNVPFFIYSPMLNQTKKMKSVSSHFDFAPTLLAFLSKNYQIQLPKETAWLGAEIDTAKNFRNVHKIPLMRYKGSINDYIYKDYLLSDGVLYQINKSFNTKKVKDQKMYEEITTSFKAFKNLNAYVTNNDKIYPKTDQTFVIKRHEFTKQEQKTLDSLLLGISLDKAFNKARDLAFKNQRVKARLICDYILNKEPNYIDVLLLKGRSLAWDGDYQAAEDVLLNALKRSPYYDDVYLALLDVYWWSSQNDKSKGIVEMAIKNKIKNDDVAFKMARAYVTLNENEKAIRVMDSILKRQPKNEEFIKFKNTLQ